MAMPDSELKTRKKVQAAAWRTTGTLGLVALGTRLGAKTPMRLAAKSPKLKRISALNPDKMKDLSNATSIAAGGVGGASSFNSAAISSAEAKRRVRKNHTVSAFGIEHD